MCSLYTLKTNPQRILDQLKMPLINFWELMSQLSMISPDSESILQESGNQAIDLRPQGFLKTNLAPVIFQNSHQQLEIKMMNFSFCPSWSKEFPVKFTTYNARMERPHPKIKDKTEYIYEVPTWKEAFIKGQTCLVPMTSAIESSYFGKSAGKMIGFHQKNSDVFFVAGLYNEWVNKTSGEIHDTFTLITDNPYRFFFEHGHDRSVFVINPDVNLIWLTDKKMTPQERFQFLRQNRVSLEWDVTVEREMKSGWEKRAPKDPEIQEIQVWD